ncbi:Gon7 family protein [Coniochaeta ligniaria NRRL 30616]|uniref:EKC/KEOPS complex subunit GON7 n=1 Tax=Coniochaeta ligniaria NRRL 30616 TaxID=1408157 RepID=A0A1J7IEK2_9PEZI|nr:Gon7 family protein [Coniochaeta ligniaria NRRL 30616]
MATPNGDAAAPAKQHVFSATYQSGTNEPFSFSQTFQAPDATDVEQKTSYLAGLRAAVVDTQEKVNKELTARMDEDKARDATGQKIADVDEAKEEENYGEEVVEEEE